MIIGAEEIIRRSYRLYKANYRLYFKYVLLNFVPGLVSLVMYLVTIPMIFAALYIDRVLAISLGTLTVVLSVAIAVIGMWFHYAFIRAVSSNYTNNKTDAVVENLKKTWHGLAKGVLTTIMVNVYALAPLFISGILLFTTSAVLRHNNIDKFPTAVSLIFWLMILYSIVHIIRYYIRLVFSIFETVIYGMTVKKSLSESQVLVAGRWWGTFWRVVAPATVFWLVGMIASGMLTQIGTQVGGIIDTILGLIAVLISVFLTPLFTAASVILFHESERKA